LKNFTAVENDLLPILAPMHKCAISVYVAIKSYADRNGECYPSLEDIARRSGCSVSTVQRIIPSMKTAGLFQSEERNSSSGKTTNYYRFSEIPTVRQNCGTIAQRSARPLPGFSVTTTTGHADLAVTRTRKQYPTNKNQRAIAGVVVWWNELAKEIGAPAVRTDPIAKELVKLWARTSKDAALREAFADLPRLGQGVRTSSFLRGWGGFKLSWLFQRHKASGEWNAARVLDGTYSDKKAKNNDRFVYDPNRPIPEKF
jgi:GntR family transcriptional regulator